MFSIPDDEEIVQIKEEIMDDYKENDSEEEPIYVRKTKKRKAKAARKKSSEDPTYPETYIINDKERPYGPKKKCWQMSSKEVKHPSELPADFTLPKHMDYYKKLALKPLSYKKKFKSSEKDIRCATCNLKFTTRKQLDSHNFKSHADFLKCPYCHKIMKSHEEGLFKVHLFHHFQLADHCVQCGKDFFKSGRYKQHLKASGPYHDDQCPHCDKHFKHHKELRLHVEFDHTGGWVHKCGFCKDVFKKEKELRFHIGYVHRGTLKLPLTEEEKKPKREVCELCGNSYLNIKTHIQQFHERVDHQVPCPHCDAKLRTKNVLKKHIEWFHILDPCPDCGKMFGRAKMRKHRLVWHESERKFKCDICPKSFITNQSLRDHRNVHTGEKPYKCKFCTACFASNGTHRMHERGHLGHKRSSK